MSSTASFASIPSCTVSKRLRRPLLLLALIAVAACAPTSKMPQISKQDAEAEAEKERELVLDAYIKDAGRLANVTFRIFSANADLCKDRTRVGSGVLLINKEVVGKEYEQALFKRLQVKDEVAVMAVANGSPADVAGIRVGDQLLRMNDWTIPPGTEGAKQIAGKFEEMGKDGKPVSLTIRRDGQEQTVSVSPVKLCAFNAGVVYGDDINAFADGKNLAVFTGMIRFVESDEELATVVGHETAHNLMDHIDKQTGNRFLGLLLDILAAGAGVNTQGTFGRMAGLVYSQEFEAEADYVGLYLMARAGYKIDDAPNFWRRMAISHPSAVKGSFGATHPSTPERFLALEKTVTEIEAKEKSGQLLLPESEIPEKKTGEKDARSPWQ